LLYALFCALVASAGAADYGNRTFTAVEFGNQTNRPADVLNTESKKMNNIVKGAIKTNSCYALEKKTAFAWGYTNGMSAWNAVKNFSSSSSNYSGKVFDNVGWTRGTKLTEGKWSAFLWTMKNHLEFKSSETDKWTCGSGWVVITNVIVAGLSNYPPMTDHSADWPDVGLATSNYPGDNQGEEKIYNVDLTAYFQLAIPDISVSPPEAVAAVGCSAVQFTAVGTNIQYGVVWSISPSGVSSGACLTNVAGYSVGVTPGTVPQVYKIRAASSNCPDYYDDGKLTVVRAELKSIEFTSDHESGGANLLKDNNSNWTDNGTAYVEPEWGKIPGRTNPISHTMNTKLAAKVTVKVEPSGVTFDLIGDGSDDYVDFHKTGNNSTGSDQEFTVTADANLPDQVCTLTKSIDWKIEVGTNECSAGSSGAHKIYVTYTTPYGSEVTEKRLSWACEACNGGSTPTGIAEKVYTTFASDPPIFSLTNYNVPNPLWRLMEGAPYRGQCIDLANLMLLAIKMIGGSGTIGYVYGSTNADCFSTSSEAFESRTPCANTNHPGTEIILVYSAAGGAWNNWEAVCKVQNTCYGIKLYEGTAIDILRYWLEESGNYQAWCYQDESGWHVCTDPGPYPVPEP